MCGLRIAQTFLPLVNSFPGTGSILMKYKAVFLLFICWLLVFQTKAFNAGDTNASKKPHNITIIYTEHSIAPFNQWQKLPWSIDTTVDKLQYYLPQYSLGNSGSPYVPIIFDAGFRPLGFYYGNNYLGPQLYSDSNIHYYNTRAPYAQIYYVTDPKIHQFIHFVFTQNIGKKFNYALEFQRTRSDGIYLNQNTNINQLTLTLNYHTKRYLLLTDGIFGVDKINQNGGVTGDTIIGSSIFSNRQTAPINLAAARSTFKELSAHFKQYFFFGFDKSDSTKSAVTLFYLSHSFRVASNTNIFSDPGPLNGLFYKNILLDTAKTYDSLHFTEITNDISFGTGKRWPNTLRWEAGITQQYVHFHQGIYDSIFNNYTAHVCIYDTGRILYNLQGSEVFLGNQSGDVHASACFGYLIDSLRSVRIQGEYASQNPAVQYQLYYGNNLQWENNFNRTNTSSLSLIYHDVKWRLSLILQATQIQNYTYLDNNIIPQQYNPAIQVLSADLRKEFQLGKWHWITDDILQYVPDSLPLRLPRFVLENSVFYQNYIFHHNMLFKIGVDVYYNTSYYGYAYMPVINQYYIENTEKVGDYVFVDPFISFRVKTLRMFIRLENAGQGLLGYNYFYAINYPMPDRVLRLGITWDFWN